MLDLRAYIAALAAFVGIALGCAGLPSVDAGPNALNGRYEDLNQSDWTLAVELAAGGVAVVEYDWWDAKRGTTQLLRRDARWERSDERVLLRYGDITDTLELRSRLRDETGAARGRGFESVGPIHRKSIIGASRLWKVEAAAR